MDIIEQLKDLHDQATHERSHFYVGSVVRSAINEILTLREARTVDAGAMLDFLRKEFKAYRKRESADYDNTVGASSFLEFMANRLGPSLATPKPTEPNYAYKTIEEYEGYVDSTVNQAFRIGWDMARTTEEHLSALVERSNGTGKAKGE